MKRFGGRAVGRSLRLRLTVSRSHRLTALLALIVVSACGDATDARAGGAAVELDRAARASLADSLAARADSLVRAGRPWRATVLLAPRLKNLAGASPELRLAGARAAAAWDGWTEVERLLRDATWLDTRFGGEGRELLARSGLERGEDAVLDAKLAADAATDDASRVLRRVLLARAFDRANLRDSAAAAYAAAAGRLPAVADWLRLRAAGVTTDSAARRALFARVTSAVARERIVPTDAQARERAGDFAGAERLFAESGAMGSAFRVASLAARDDPARAAVARRILDWLGRPAASAEVRQVIEVLDRMKMVLSADQHLVVGRAAAENGAPARAVAAFESAGVANLSPRDRSLHAGVLLRAGRAAEAARQYALAAADPALAPLASYNRARALLEARDGAGARAALRETASRHAGVAAAAAPALMLLADLQMDDGDVAGARRSLADLLSRYPAAPQAPLARFRAGIAAWPNARAALAQFDSLLARYPRDEEALAARYWAARAADRLGQRADAERRWSEIVRSSPLSYYAELSAARLRRPGWRPPPPASAPRDPAADSALERIRELMRLGMEVEARFEADALVDRAERNAASAAAVPQALVAAEQPVRAMRVAMRALDSLPPGRALLRAGFPLLHADALVAEARRHELDPALLAGLIRQESSWNPRAVSPVGARGLMQLMPDVGAAIARSRGYPLWTPALLFEPEVSLELGTSHLAAGLRRATNPARALAAYNAGASRLARWSRRPGTADPELLTEWIPFTETRDYVRIVQRNAAVYRALYDLK